LDDNGWPEYSKLVLSEIKDLKASVDDLDDKITEIQLDLVMLKVKSGVWGGLAGLIPVIIAAFIVLIRNGN